MAQTARSFAALEALFADNTDEDIDAVQLRDFLESALGCYGQLEIDGGSTAEGLTATPAKLDTWLALGPGRNTSSDIVSPAGDLQLDADGIWAVSFEASFLVATGTDRFAFALRADNVAVTGFGAEITGTLGERVQVSFKGLYSATSGVALSVYAAAVGAAGDITIEHARLAAHRVG
jgi:hypothetical protein